MATKPRNRIVQAVVRGMWKRDQLQMRAVDALLSAVDPPKPRGERQRRLKKKKKKTKRVR